MNCKLIKVGRQVKSKKDGKEFTIYDLYLCFENGNKYKILPNSYVGSDKKNHSNQDVLLALASTDLPF